MQSIYANTLGLCLALGLAASCNQSSFGGGSKGKANKKPAASAAPPPENQADTGRAQDAAPSPTSERQEEAAQTTGGNDFAKVKEGSLAEYLQNAIATSNNDVVEIDGYQLSNLQDFLSQNENQVQILGTSYPTISDYFESIGVHSEADILPERVDQGLAMLEKLLRRGFALAPDKSLGLLQGGGLADAYMASAGPTSLIGQAALGSLGAKQLDEDDDWGHWVDPENDPWDPEEDPGHLPGAPPAWGLR